MNLNRALILLALVLLATPAFAEQDYVARYDVYVGYEFLNSNTVNLFQPGFHIQGRSETAEVVRARLRLLQV